MHEKRTPPAQRKTRPGLNNITMTKLHSVSISLTSSELLHGQAKFLHRLIAETI